MGQWEEVLQKMPERAVAFGSHWFDGHCGKSGKRSGVDMGLGLADVNWLVVAAVAGDTHYDVDYEEDIGLEGYYTEDGTQIVDAGSNGLAVVALVGAVVAVVVADIGAGEAPVVADSVGDGAPGHQELGQAEGNCIAGVDRRVLAAGEAALGHWKSGLVVKRNCDGYSGWICLAQNISCNSSGMDEPGPFGGSSMPYLVRTWKASTLSLVKAN